MIANNPITTHTATSDMQSLDNIKLNASNKTQLKKVTQEFEAVFVTKMLTLMDKTVDSEGGIFGEDTKYLDSFKSVIFQEMGRDIARNPNTSFGFAKQMYSQMEKFLPPDTENSTVSSTV